ISSSYCLVRCSFVFYSFFFFTDSSTSDIYTLSLHDLFRSCNCAMCFYPSILGFICRQMFLVEILAIFKTPCKGKSATSVVKFGRSEEHTSELQSPYDIVCRLLLEKKKNTQVCIETIYCQLY